MFKWLMGKKKPPLTREARGRTTEAVDSWPQKSASKTEIRQVGRQGLTIPALNFYGTYTSSPNGRFRIAWRDGFDRGDGLYVLIEGEDIICQGSMERAQDGKVADNGVFILNDWRSPAMLAGTFRAFHTDGSVLLTVDYAANLFNNGLSEDGRFAACQTCNSSDEKDSAVLTVFDLVNGKELYRFRAESGWPRTYAFSADGEFLTLGYPNDGGTFTYRLDGTFIDRNVWIAARLDRGDLYMVRQTFDDAGGKPDQEVALRLLESVERGLADTKWRDDRLQAFGFRLRGELLEASGKIQAALESYDKAIELNPKIGIKRRADQLRRARSASTKRDVN